MKSCLTLLAAAFACGAATAGTVHTTFVDPARFTDAGMTADDRQQTQADLAYYLARLGQRLPANQQLDIEVLDVDLAGKLRPSRRDSSGWVRIARSDVDWPRIHLRYTLRVDGQPVRSGQEWVQDMGFASGIGAYTSYPLQYEKRMLSRWMGDRFGGPTHASR